MSIPPIISTIVGNRYLLTVNLFVVWMLVFDDNNFFSQLRIADQAEQLKNDEALYRQRIDSLKSSLDELKNKDAIETFAREKYFMKRPNEDIFVVDEVKK